jgi:hypothetical protein
MMKTIFFATILAAAVLVGACSNGGTGTDLPPTSGTATIDSRVVNNQGSGFSFVQAAIIKFPNSSKIFPDIEVLVNISQTGGVIGVYFARPDSLLLPAFQLLRRFSVLDSARSYFNNLGEIPDTTYEELALPVEVGDVWAVKTRRSTYAKILITQTVAYTDSTNPSAPTPFGQATFDWSYQPNGARIFYTIANGR